MHLESWNFFFMLGGGWLNFHFIPFSRQSDTVELVTAFRVVWTGEEFSVLVVITRE